MVTRRGVAKRCSTKKPHLDAIMRILKYLKISHGQSLLFKKYGHLHIQGYSNLDWARSLIDRRSTIDYCTYVGRNLVTGKSKKHSVVARSSVDA